TRSIWTLVFLSICVAPIQDMEAGGENDSQPPSGRTGAFPIALNTRAVPQGTRNASRSSGPLRRLHAAEADVGHAGVRATAVAGAGPVARAVAVVAQERAAALHPLGHEGAGRVVGSVR